MLLIAFANSNAQIMNITDTSVTKENSELSYNVTATYPQVNFGPDALMGVRGIAEDINNSLDTTVSGMISEFEKQVSDLPNKTIDGTGSSLEITSRAWISNGSLLSCEITTFSAVAGMAHPLTTITALNYTVEGEGPLSLSDLFLSNAEYLNYISTVCIQQLSAKAQKEGYENVKDMILSGASADAKNFNQWVVNNDSLYIIFNVYQVMPYVMGIQTVPIPLSEMTSMLDPKGPLSFMFR